ncbi:hypothetical protein HRG_006256 [Hirsutella rhossiliensis]|uniref:Uncharacterized protein n=1 Tax=Hirsutella rhossiliensis TaxID=111463 RepID=A0A9P8N0L5_9HYPO|nr:uncharacterized protein HRG_06256 [Hirsutella rhossiliensis]KAH0963746.1 hypothetical protein HRG_06256 [Hirsutella rhossiliensis]
MARTDTDSSTCTRHNMNSPASTARSFPSQNSRHKLGQDISLSQEETRLFIEKPPSGGENGNDEPDYDEAYHRCDLHRWHNVHAFRLAASGAIYHEKRLEHNTNLHLLTSSWRSRPNRWYSNAASLFFLILSYGSSSALVLIPTWIATGESTPYNGIYPGYQFLINATALVGLGVALAGQAAIAA